MSAPARVIPTMEQEHLVQAIVDCMNKPGALEAVKALLRSDRDVTLSIRQINRLLAAMTVDAKHLNAEKPMPKDLKPDQYTEALKTLYDLPRLKGQNIMADTGCPPPGQDRWAEHFFKHYKQIIQAADSQLATDFIRAYGITRQAPAQS